MLNISGFCSPTFHNYLLCITDPAFLVHNCDCFHDVYLLFHNFEFFSVSFCLLLCDDIFITFLFPFIRILRISVIPSALIAYEARFFCFSRAVVYRFHAVRAVIAYAAAARKSIVTSLHSIRYTGNACTFDPAPRHLDFCIRYILRGC